jgi:hypothetical protein
MRVLCISSHSGCLANLEGLLETRGADVTSFYTYKKIPFVLQEGQCKQVWDEYKSDWNTYDLIITGDSMCLAYMFLKNIDELKPKLMIWIMNRFDNQMGHIPEYTSFIRNALKNPEYEKKIKFVPYTEYERYYAASVGVYLKESVLLPYGVKRNVEPIPSYIDTDRSGMISPEEDTVFLMHYGNDHAFMPFQDIFKQAGISVLRSQFNSIEEVKPYKCVVHLPDAFSKFCAFEFLVAGVPVFLPSEEFFKSLNPCARQLPDGKIEKYCFTVNGNIVPQPLVPYCEWYKYPNSKVYFDSIEDLIYKLKAFTKAKRDTLLCQMRKDAEYHTTYVKLTFDKFLRDLFD